MTANNEAATRGDSDRRSPTLESNHPGQNRDLTRRVGVWISRVWHQRCDVYHLGKRAPNRRLVAGRPLILLGVFSIWRNSRAFFVLGSFICEVGYDVVPAVYQRVKKTPSDTLTLYKCDIIPHIKGL